MSNGSEGAAVKGNRMTAIMGKLNYLHDACKENLNLSSEIRAKLLCTDVEKASKDEKQPKEAGQLNNIRDQLQDVLNVVTASNAHLISVNKEV